MISDRQRGFHYAFSQLPFAYSFSHGINIAKSYLNDYDPEDH